MMDSARQWQLRGGAIEGLAFDEKGNIVDDFDDIVVRAVEKKKNSNLTKAKKAKNDEFYTQLCDIEKELSHYPIETFKDKVIYCPMDVATTQGAILRSEFVHYFQMHAHEFQFKELIATCLHDKSTGEGYADDDVRSNNYHLKRYEVSYATPENKASGKSPIDEVKNEVGQLCYKYADGRLEPIPDNVVNECILDTDGNLIIESEGTPQLYHYQGYFREDCKPDEGFDGDDVEGSNSKGLYGSGDFRSKHCCRYLEQADIVITNPPFSVFKQFYLWIKSAKKQFIILGNRAVYSQDYMFSDLCNNVCWLGALKSHWTLFMMPTAVEKKLQEDLANGFLKVNYGTGHDKSYTLKDGVILKGVNVGWFTNVDFEDRHERLIGLSKSDYEAKGVVYNFYDDFDALDVAKTAEIPMDYEGLMGVPITYLDKHCNDQFEVIRTLKDVHIDGKACYARVLICHRKDGNGRLVQ